MGLRIEGLKDEEIKLVVSSKTKRKIEGLCKELDMPIAKFVESAIFSEIEKWERRKRIRTAYPRLTEGLW